MNGLSETLLIHARPASARVRYITDLMLGRRLGLTLAYTESETEYDAFPGPKICYGHEPLPGGLFLGSSGLLAESSIHAFECRVTHPGPLPVLFPVTRPEAALPYDPFAAGFYMVSRYEEYLPFRKDRYGRFPAQESLAYREGFLELPVVDLWAEEVGARLKAHYPGMVLEGPGYRYVPTIDVDHAWSYLGRPPARTLAAMARAVLRGDPGDVFRRLRVLSGRAADPFDSYNLIETAHADLGQKVLWFILFADYGGDDNNVMLNSPAFRDLLAALDHAEGVGIHPSLASGRHPSILEDEYYGLSEMIGRQVTSSRQHFLKLSFPKTYRALISLGITDDYSMGFASHPGFRAGIAGPFPFFDLARNEATPLRVHPVTVMDVTLRDYLRLNPEESLNRISRLVEVTRKVNGEFVSLFHNESLSGTGRWKGWTELYLRMARLASE